MVFDEIKSRLGTNKLIPTGAGGGGCINQGEAYKTDDGIVFIKSNGKAGARTMFDGEYESLKAIAATETIKCPIPHFVVTNPVGGASLVMEYVEMGGLRSQEKALGEQLAKLHLHNIEMEEKCKNRDNFVGENSEMSSLKYIDRFGFDVPTCCGFLPQDNTWKDDWVVFYTTKLQSQIDRISNDKELSELWIRLVTVIPKIFKNIEVKPSLLHGDLWSGNAAQSKEGPVIFDPASFYGHHEYDLAIMNMFGGFGSKFYNAYHSSIPKSEGFDDRLDLYELFHHLNHWNHFGSGYRGGSLRIMKNLVKKFE